jgi:hypothetical protein
MGVVIGVGVCDVSELCTKLSRQHMKRWRGWGLVVAARGVVGACLAVL